jgi:hypothetical protein
LNHALNTPKKEQLPLPYSFEKSAQKWALLLDQQIASV